MAKMAGLDPRCPWGGGCERTCCNTRQQQRTNKKAVKQSDKRLTASLPREDEKLVPMFYEREFAREDRFYASSFTTETPERLA